MANENIHAVVGVDSSQATKGLNEVAGAAKSFRQQCKELQEELSRLTLEGKEGTEEYQAVAKELGTLRDAMSDASREANSYANDTRKLTLAIGALKDGIAIYGALTSALSAFGVESDSMTKTIKRLQTIQLAMNSAQQVYASLLDKSTLLGKAYAAMSKTITLAMNGVRTGTLAATVATNEFKTALTRTGIGAVVVLLGSLAAAYMTVSDANEAANKKAQEELKLKDEQIKKEQELRKEKEKTFNQTLRELRILKGEELSVLEEEEAKAKKAFDEYISKNTQDLGELPSGRRSTVRKLSYDEGVANKLELAWRKATKAKEDYIKSSKKSKSTPKPSEGFWDEDEETAAYPKVSINYQHQKEGDMETEANGGNIMPTFRQRFKEWNEENQESIQAVGQAATQVTQLVADSIATMFDMELEEVRNNLDAVDERIDKTTEKIAGHSENIANYQTALADASGADKQRLLDQIAMENEAMAEEEKRLADEQKEKDKLKKDEAAAEYKKKKADAANAIVQGLLNTALGISAALTQTPPASYIMAATTAAMGAAQTAIIAAQASKIKKSYGNGGLLEGPLHSDGGIPVGTTGVEVEGGEFVVNRRATAANLPLLMAINGGAGSGRMRYADGGVLNVDTRDYVNYQPVVSVVDINRVQEQMVKVADMAR